MLMFAQRNLLQLMLFGAIVLAAAAAAAAMTTELASLAKPDCHGMCGDVRIPYPFGMTESCYYSEDFLITCNDTAFNPPQPFLTDTNIQVTNISINGEMSILNDIAHDCYAEDGTRLGNNQPRINLAKFRFSSTRNKFTSVGCDTEAVIYGYQGEREYASGCLTICGSLDYVINGSCSGIGCCQTSIPPGVSRYEVSLTSRSNHTNVWNFSRCGFAFVVDEDKFNFNSAQLTNLESVTKLPVVLDWAITNKTCEIAQKNETSYACMNNSECYNAADNDAGYRCRCLPGYQGNAYLPNTGCQDIDECEDPSLNNCVKKCENTPGNFTCSCPKGYHGDGTKDGNGCIADQRLVIISVCVGSIGAILLLLIAAWWLYKIIKKGNDRKRKEKFFKLNGGFLLQQEVSSSDGSVEKTKLFDSRELEKATDHYNEDRILGQGGQGTVYKGMLSDGRIVAIKKSKIVDQGQIKTFINEVVILSQINHRNVVKLLGCCLETEVPMLVYELISNGTLFQHIHDPNEDFLLSWEMRFRIAIEVAGALSYLHNAVSIPIYHRDIKSTNILLDDKYKAKVADFGTSRSVAIDQTHLTTLVQGTFGYLDPEYFQSSQFTEKSDVYSFGVVIVELLTGQKPISSNRSQESRSLATYFIQSMDENRLLEILDPRIFKEESRREEMIAVAHLGKKCLNLNGKKRPTMRQVAIELEGIRILSQGGSTMTQQECEEVDLYEVWDAASTSTGTFSVTRTAASFDIQPLLVNKPRGLRCFSVPDMNFH